MSDVRSFTAKCVAVLGKLQRLSTAKKVLLALALIVVAMSAFLVVSEQPAFCNSCHIMNPYYASWKSSSHNEVACLDCHMQPGFMGHVKGKINGMAQAVDCAVGRVGTKPNAHVLTSPVCDPSATVPKNWKPHTLHRKVTARQKTRCGSNLRIWQLGRA